MLRSIFGSSDLLWFLMSREIRVRYRRSVLGLVWALAQPLPLALVLYLVFAGQFGAGIPNYTAYVLTGVVFWSYFQNATLSALNSLHRHVGVLRQMPVPAGAFPAAAVLASSVHFLLSLTGLLVFFALTGSPLSPALAFLPVSIALIVSFALGVGLLLSPLSLLFSDVNEAAVLGLGLLAYLTPTFYPISIVPIAYRPFVMYNPITALLETVRQPIYGGTVPEPITLVVAFGWSSVALCAGFASFRSQRKRIAYRA